MDESQIGLLVVGVVVAGLAALIAVMLARYGSMRGAMFGARVERELGEVVGTKGMFGRGLHAKVFVLADGDGRRVGLEFRHHGKRSYAALSARDALQLAELLQRAAR